MKCPICKKKRPIFTGTECFSTHHRDYLQCKSCGHSFSTLDIKDTIHDLCGGVVKYNYFGYPFCKSCGRHAPLHECNGNSKLFNGGFI